MASSYPMKKNTATKIVFPILDADGDPVSSAAGLDSEYSLDGGSFSDCSNEATEIGSSGIYYLSLVAGETNGDVVCIQVKTSTSGAKTTVLVFYTAAQTLDELDTVADAIKAKTDNLPADPADDSDIDGQLSTIDTVVDAIKAKTDNLPADPADDSDLDSQLSTIDTVVDAIKAKTDNLPSDPADESLLEAEVNAVHDDILDANVEGTHTVKEVLRLLAAVLAGKSSGGGTVTLKYRDLDDSKDRITATVDSNGNRTAMTLDES